MVACLLRAILPPPPKPASPWITAFFKISSLVLSVPRLNTDQRCRSLSSGKTSDRPAQAGLVVTNNNIVRRRDLGGPGITAVSPSYFHTHVGPSQRFKGTNRV